MINITLLKTSDDDGIFEESALCLRNSLRGCGVVSEIFRNTVNYQGYTVFFGAGLRCKPSVFREIANKATSAIFNLEQLRSRLTVVDHDYLKLLSEYPVLDYHSDNINYLRSVFNKADCFEVPLVPHFDLVNKQAVLSRMARAKTSDFLFYGSLNARRLEVLQQLLKSGFSLEVFTEGLYEKNLTSALLSTRAVLHIHYHETALFPAARLLQPMILGVPIICEESIFSEASDYAESGITFTRYQDFVLACEDRLTALGAEAELSRKTLEKIATVDFEAYWGKFSAALNLR
jgi:hypothetical protein